MTARKAGKEFVRHAIQVLTQEGWDASRVEAAFEIVGNFENVLPAFRLADALRKKLGDEALTWAQSILIGSASLGQALIALRQQKARLVVGETNIEDYLRVAICALGGDGAVSSPLSACAPRRGRPPLHFSW